jgi:DNA polymerase III subunit epsilon
MQTLALSKRQVFLDTETTGLSVNHGDRVVEIGCVETINGKLTGRKFHTYCNPNRGISAKALRVHGLSAEFLRGHPVFAEIADGLLAFVAGAEVLIHNAPFDTVFINLELAKLQMGSLENSTHKIIDTLPLARKRFPDQRNGLDALCLRLGLLSANRGKHGALEDAHLLAQVYPHLKNP